MNIPICDVATDQDYDRNVKDNFILPPSYVRHSKKIGDEADISIDYNMDDQDLVRTIIICTYVIVDFFYDSLLY